MTKETADAIMSILDAQIEISNKKLEYYHGYLQAVNEIKFEIEGIITSEVKE